MAGSGRRKLKIKDPQRYSWQPKEVLAQIAAIYVHLSRADDNAVFAREIAKDERSYNSSMFAEASEVCCFLHSLTCSPLPALLRRLECAPFVLSSAAPGLQHRRDCSIIGSTVDMPLQKDPKD